MGMENFPSVRSVVFTRVLVVYHLPHIVHLSCLHTIQQLHTQRKWSQQLNTNTKILCVNISYQSHENSPKSRGLYECVSSSIWSPASLIACIMIRQQWPRLCFGDFSPSSHFFFSWSRCLFRYETCAHISLARSFRRCYCLFVRFVCFRWRICFFPHATDVSSTRNIRKPSTISVRCLRMCWDCERWVFARCCCKMEKLHTAQQIPIYSRSILVLTHRYTRLVPHKQALARKYSHI